MKAYFKLTQYPKMAPPNSAYRLYQPDPVDDAVLLCDTVSIRYWTPGNDNSDCILDGQFQSGQGADMRVSGSSGSNKWRSGRCGKLYFVPEGLRGYSPLISGNATNQPNPACWRKATAPQQHKLLSTARTVWI